MPWTSGPVEVEPRGALHQPPGAVPDRGGTVRVFTAHQSRRWHHRGGDGPLGKTRPDAVTQAWITLGTTMYQVMGRLAADAADEQR